MTKLTVLRMRGKPVTVGKTGSMPECGKKEVQELT